MATINPYPWVDGEVLYGADLNDTVKLSKEMASIAITNKRYANNAMKCLYSVAQPICTEGDSHANQFVWQANRDQSGAFGGFAAYNTHKRWDRWGAGWTSSSWNYFYYADGADATPQASTHAHGYRSPTTIGHGAMQIDYQIFNLLDNFNDSVISGDWTTSGTVTESGGQLRLGNGSTDGNAYYTAKDFYHTRDSVWFMCNLHRVNTSNSARAVVRITDGTNYVDTVYQTDGTGTAGSSIPCFIRLRFNGTDDTVEVWRDENRLRSVSLTTLTGNIWYVEFRAIGGSVSGKPRIDVWWFADDDKSLISSTITPYMSADGGANWEATTLGATHEFTNTGTFPSARIDVTLDTSEVMILYGMMMTWED